MNNYHNLFSQKKLFIFCLLATLLSACGTTNQEQTKTIAIDGSSTVYPITKLIAENFNKSGEEAVEVEVDFSGSISGFAKFCSGETDINNASVPIPQEFMAKCKENGIPYIELPIAFDAITVVVNSQNDWLETISVEQLKAMWQQSSQNKVNLWNQVDSQWPDVAMNLFAPGEDSGTYEYFNLAILGQGQASRRDYVFSEDDEALVNGVMQDPNAIAYFGFAYYEQHQDNLKAVAIDHGSGGVIPTDETIKNGSYRPLTRPLFIYVNAQKAQQNNALSKFVEFYLAQASTNVAQAGYVPLPDSGYHLANIHFQENKVGTIFNGSPVLNASIDELLTKTYASEDKEGYVF